MDYYSTRGTTATTRPEATLRDSWHHYKLKQLDPMDYYSIRGTTTTTRPEATLRDSWYHYKLKPLDPWNYDKLRPHDPRNLVMD